MQDLLQGLNASQQEVVLATDGPVLVLAGAGSGKTRALTHRIAYILAQHLARSEEILAVTFTNKAAGEMRERVQRLLAGRAYPQAMGTFHGLSARILREQHHSTARSAHFMILDEQDSLRFIKRAMEAAGVSPKHTSAAGMRAGISRAKHERHVPDNEAAALVFQHYQALLARADAYDFDDLLVESVALLEREERIRATYQARWRYLSVDEYQDVNALQVRWTTLLTGPAKNVCVVGDNHQAIYSWRGATVDHILTFAQQFPGCKTLHLTQNYRSTPQVLAAANTVILDNTTQSQAELWTARPAQGKSPVHLASFLSDRSEAAWVRSHIETWREQGGNVGECAVLYRTNAQSRAFEEELLTAEIPYTIVGGFRFYERREIKDALALLTLSVNPGAVLAWQRVAQALWRGVGPKTLQQWERRAQAGGRSLADVVRAQAGARASVRGVAAAYELIHDKNFATVAERLEWLLKKSGYSAYLATQPDSEERLANVEELLNVTSVYTDVTTFLETVALLSDIDVVERAAQHTLGEPRPADAGRVMCMTLHAAKGLEFANVFIVGCEEGLLPHSNALASRAQLEEERRLLYVGMTRAKERLTLTYAQYRFLRGQRTLSLPSRFLSALPDSVERIDPVFASDGVDGEPREELIDYAWPRL